MIFYTNGYEHWLWDDTRYPPRAVQGFYKKDELELLIQRRADAQAAGRGATINAAIVERYYQTRAIRRIAEAFERDHERKALLVMATGAGKTRTVIALADLLMRCNWVKRVLFLADRVALVNQAVNAFKTHLPDAVAGEPGHREGRRGPGLRLDLSDDDGPDRRDAGRPAALRRRPLRPGRSSTRRTARSTRSTARSSTTSTRCWSA